MSPNAKPWYQVPTIALFLFQSCFVLAVDQGSLLFKVTPIGSQSDQLRVASEVRILEWNPQTRATVVLASVQRRVEYSSAKLTYAPADDAYYFADRVNSALFRFDRKTRELRLVPVGTQVTLADSVTPRGVLAMTDLKYSRGGMSIVFFSTREERIVKQLVLPGVSTVNSDLRFDRLDNLWFTAVSNGTYLLYRVSSDFQIASRFYQAPPGTGLSLLSAGNGLVVLSQYTLGLDPSTKTWASQLLGISTTTGQAREYVSTTSPKPAYYSRVVSDGGLEYGFHTELDGEKLKTSISRFRSDDRGSLSTPFREFSFVTTDQPVTSVSTLVLINRFSPNKVAILQISNWLRTKQEGDYFAVE